MRFWLTFVAIVLIAAPVLVGDTVAADKDDTKKAAEKYKITTKKADDVVDVQAEKDKVIFDVKSPSGISQAVIERLEDKWPESVVLRVRLKALESFKADNGKVILQAAVSSADLKTKLKLIKDGKAGDALDEKSPYWMDVRAIGADGKPAKEIPLKNGYFEMTMPKALLEGNPKSLTLNWIDLYRN
jgi:hypothetical protein